MPELELIYFPVMGRAEIIRDIFRYANIEYKDTRISKEEFSKRSKDGEFPTGQLPVLKIDGKQICESLTIAQYALKLANLIQDDTELETRINEAAMVMLSLLEPLGQIYRNPNSAKELTENWIKQRLPRLENYVKLRSGESPTYLIDNKFSYADLAAYTVFKQVFSEPFNIPEQAVKDNAPTFYTYLQGLRSKSEFEKLKV